jgi:predicted alpha/beta hydrolase family esterase
LLVASEDDPYITLDAAETLAADWRCGFVNVGRVGHINCASGFGDWVEGERLLVGLMDGDAARTT